MARLYDISLQITYYLVHHMHSSRAFNECTDKAKEFKRYKSGCLFFWRDLQEEEAEAVRSAVTNYSRIHYKMFIVSVGNKDLNDSLNVYGTLQNHSLTFTLGMKKENEVCFDE